MPSSTMTPSNDDNLSSKLPVPVPASEQLSQQFQGILYKRRDVMKRQWRPRLFVLNYELCVLSYYLLNDEYGPTNGSNDGNFQNHASNFDYDVVPRGSINLRGCIVETIADPRTEKNEKLFKFCITPMRSSSAGGDVIAYLAATSPQKREEWVQRIANLCCRNYSNQRLQNSFAETASSPLMLRIPENQPNYEHANYQDERSTSSISTTPSLTELESKVLRKCDKKYATLEGIKETDSLHHETAQTSGEENDQRQNQVSSSRNSQVNTNNNGFHLYINENDGRTKDVNENMNLYNNVPLDLAEKIDDIINTFLPMCDAGFSMNHTSSQEIGNIHNLSAEKSFNSIETNHADKWQFLSENNGVLVHERPLPSKKYDETSKSKLLKSEAILSNHSPLEIFELIIDITQSSKYETNIQKAVRLEQYNNFTFCDFFTYQASWPTQTRDFCVATHWRLLNSSNIDNNKNKDDPTILIVSFSWDRDDICPPQQNIVRGKYLVCLYVLQKCSSIRRNSKANNLDQCETKGNDGCRLIRLLCADLGGTIHPSMSNAVMQQNALVLASINEYLISLKSNQEYQINFKGIEKMTPSFIVQNIIKPRKQFWETNAKELNFGKGKKQNGLSITTECPIGNATESLQRMKNDNFSLNLEDKENKINDENSDELNGSSKNESSYHLKNTKLDCRNVDESLSIKTAIFFGLFLLGRVVLSLNPVVAKDDDVYGWFMILVKFLMLFLLLATIKVSIDRLIYAPCKPSESIQMYAELSPLPFSSLLVVLMMPFFACEVSVLFTPLPYVRQISFISISLMISRVLVKKSFGVQIKRAELQTGPIICRFNVNVKGILRFIELKREESIEKTLFSKSKASEKQPFIEQIEYKKPPMITEISVTHIVVKAIACAMSEVPALNSFNISYPFLGIRNETFTSCNGVAISVASNLNASSNTILKNVDTMSVQEIANELWMIQMNDVRKKRKKEDYFSLIQRFMRLFSLQTSYDGSEQGAALVITSPDSEHNEVDIDVLPSSQARDPNITILVGGIRVRRDDKGKARPLLSMSITINSPICNVGICRRFVEIAQKFIQFPELCETT